MPALVGPPRRSGPVGSELATNQVDSGDVPNEEAPQLLLVAGASVSYPAWIRTRTKRTKIRSSPYAGVRWCRKCLIIVSSHPPVSTSVRPIGYDWVTTGYDARSPLFSSSRPVRRAEFTPPGRGVAAPRSSASSPARSPRPPPSVPPGARPRRLLRSPTAPVTLSPFPRWRLARRPATG